MGKFDAKKVKDYLNTNSLLSHMTLVELLNLYDACAIQGMDCDRCVLSNVGTETEECIALLKCTIRSRLEDITT